MMICLFKWYGREDDLSGDYDYVFVKYEEY